MSNTFISVGFPTVQVLGGRKVTKTENQKPKNIFDQGLPETG